MNFAGVSRAALLAGFLSAPVGAAVAQETGGDRDTVFILGRIENGITSSDGETINASSISEEQMRTFDRASVDDGDHQAAVETAARCLGDVLAHAQALAALGDGA